jgi:hypothetical protein
MRAEQVLPDGIPATVPPRAGDADLVDVGLADLVGSTRND